MIHLIHGIHTSGVDQAPEALLQYLPAYVAYPDYGYELALETRIVNPMIVGAIRPYVAEGDIMIGHSNGCAIIYDLLEKGVKVKGVVFINAALEQAITLPDFIAFCDVYYNSGDSITEAAQVAAALGLVDLIWGEMGHAGYKGTDPRVTNVDCGSTAGMPKVSGHSAIFAKGNLEAWGPRIANGLVHRG